MAEEKDPDTEKNSPEENNSGSETQEELFNDRVKKREITNEMEESYLDYAMSVIVQRALPDVRDGLKPVHRRILFSMHELGMRNTAKYRKSAFLVGDILGKYHPHGDTAVYDSMVRMAQEFAMRYTLVEGQGNFGSIDGDNPAAMRYTEAKMSKIAEEMLADIDKNTVNWRDNYDATRKEPVVLPSKLPQLLLNGSMGIAVGMATSIPPHNLGEVVDALINLIDNPELTIEEIMEFIKGPDFPTSGIIYNREAIKEMYVTGRGGVVIRGKAEIVEGAKGRYNIIITEIPYQVNKAQLVSKIADLVRDKKIVGISDIRDESNRQGIRVVVELKKEAFPKKILNQLFKMTSLQDTFNMNMIALVDGIQPQLLDLKSVLEHFIKHRISVVNRRTEFDLEVARARAHVLEGLTIALDHIDEVINTIKKSATKEDAAVALIKKFKLSEIQANEILAMRLQTLAGLERKKIEDEYKAKLALIKELESILADQSKVMEIIKNELKEIREKYADTRRTKIIVSSIDKISTKDTIPNEPMIIMLSRENYIKRLPQATFRSQNRGGKGVIGGTTKEEDEIKSILYAKNHDEILYFTNFGRMFSLPVYEIIEGKRITKGQPIVNLLKLKMNEKVTAMLKLGEKGKNKYLVMGTTFGTVKKTEAKQFQNLRQNGLIAIKLRGEDALQWVRESDKNEEIILVTKKGQCIRFPESDIRAMGRASMGVRGIKLRAADEVVEMDVCREPEHSRLLVVTEKGLGKCSELIHYRNQHRGGTGIKTANITEKTGDIMEARVIGRDQKGDLLIISRQGQTIRLNLKSVPNIGRATQGVYLMRLNKDDFLASISIITEDEIPAGQEAGKEASASQQKMFEPATK